ncbi:MAG: GNAT family N-acetyltransferase [Pseudomonadota bacterium]
MAKNSRNVSIVPFEARFAADFERLNVEWLERFFRVESIDAKVLGDPQTHILSNGGAILMALREGDAVGTCALKVYQPGRIELTKMAVTRSAQGDGIGRALVEAAVERFRKMQAQALFLESHSSLAPALHLYESVGFVHAPRPFKSDYQRSDVYMEWRGPARRDKP